MNHSENYAMSNKKQRSVLLIWTPLLLVALFVLSKTYAWIAEPFGGPNNLVGLLTVLLTYLYVVLTSFMVRQMAQAQEEERRPYVVVDIEMDQQETTMVLKNISKTPARDVRVQLIPDILTASEKSVNDTLFSKPIAFLPPGRIVNSFVDLSQKFFEEGKPTNFEVSMS